MNVIRNEPKEVSPIIPGPVDSMKEINEMREELDKAPLAMIPTVTTYKAPEVSLKEEKKEKVNEYVIKVEGILIGSFTINKNELHKLYAYLKDTGDFIFIDDCNSIIYLNQPKRLTITLQPKKDPWAYKKMPDTIITKQDKKKWWKK